MLKRCGATNVAILVISILTALVLSTSTWAEDFQVNVSSSKDYALEGVKVYAFTDSGSYTGYNATADSNGTAVFNKDSFTDGSYTFRVDYFNEYFWSDTVIIPDDSAVSVTIIEGDVQVTVTNPPSPLSGLNVYLYNSQGVYLGKNGTTDASGQVTFIVPVGMEVKFRVDNLGTQFWSQTYTVSAPTEATLSIPYQQVTITVNGMFQGTPTPLEGISVYLFTAAGSYLGQYQTTNSSGQTAFDLPEGTYKVRADYMNQQFWSAEITELDTTVNIPLADAQVTVTGSGLPLEGVPVYVYTASGAYLNKVAHTDATGGVTFRLAAGEYKFRADYQSTQYWSGDESLTAGQVNPVAISTGGGVLTFTVEKSAGVPLTGVNCYVFSDTGTYLNLTENTDGNGQVSFNLADGSYQIRVDHMGYQFWSPVYALTSNLSETYTIAHQDVNITVEGNYQSQEPLTGVQVYLFTEAGSYLNQSLTTDSNGQVVFNLPEQSFKVRADYQSQQHWSTPFIWQDAMIKIPLADAEITVTGAGLPLENVPVYVFTSSGTYLNINGPTDSSGKAKFRLSAGDYDFRADYQSAQYWSGDESLTAGQVNPVAISTGGGVLTFRVQKAAGVPLVGVKCYAFTEAGNYLNLSTDTDGNGQVGFNLADGNYQIRVDYMGYQFWSPVYTINGNLSATYTIDHQDVTITIESAYPATEALSGVPVYLFTGAGAYMAISLTTDAGGQVVFNLPQREYTVRADYMAEQFWSIPFTWQDTALTINRGVAVVHVTRSGGDLAGAQVFLFSAAGSYLNQVQTTDATGKVQFILPDRVYKFRIDEGGDQKWSPAVPIASGLTTTVWVDMAPIYVTLSADPNSINSGETSTLAWKSSGANSCTVNPGQISVELNGTLEVAPTETTIYTITAIGDVGTVTAETTITVTVISSEPTAQEIAAGDPLQWVRFGTSVAIDGDFAIVGATGAQSAAGVTGAAYIFRRDSSGWIQQTKLIAEDAVQNDSFGFAVDIDENTVVVGAPNSDSGETNSGAVYIFQREGETWSQRTKLISDVPASWTNFGRAVAIDGNYVIVGRPYGDGSSYAGAAYVFAFDGSGWSQQAKLAAGNPYEEDEFGTSVAISSEYAIVGATYDGSGAAHIFKRIGDSWQFQARLTASDTTFSIDFGASVAIDSDYAVVGATYAEVFGYEAGAAYVFKREGNNWIETVKLTAGDPSDSSYFGAAVAMDGQKVIVGAEYAMHNGQQSGAAYIYELEESVWTQKNKLVADSPAEYSGFGSAVDIDASYAIVGVPDIEKDGFGYAGSAYIFEFPTTVLTFNADPEIIMLGETSTLTWSSVNLSSCIIEPDIGSVDPTGAVDVTPGQNTTYTATCSGPIGTKAANTTVYVINPTLPPTVHFTAGSETVVLGESVDLTWSTTNADSVTIDQGIGAVKPSGVFSVSPAENTTYTITATGPAGTASAAVTVAVVHPSTITLIDPAGYQEVDAGLLIRWSDEDIDSNATVSLYYDSNNSGADGTLIVGGLSEDDDSQWGDSYGWDTSGLSWGDYYVYAVIDDGINAPVIDYSDMYVYVNHPLQAVTEFNIFEDEIEEFDNFGDAVDIQGDYAIVGVPQADTGGISYSGAAYIYKRHGAAWMRQTKLVAGDVTLNARFGCSVGISGEYAVVGAEWAENAGVVTGAVYLFKRDGDQWSQQQKLTPTDAGEYSYFGETVSIDGEYLIAGASYAQAGEVRPGAAYIYKRQGDIWALQAKLTDHDHPDDKNYGISVAINGEYAIVGADDYVQHPQYTGLFRGCAFIYKRLGSIWIEQSKLFIDDESFETSFGNAVTIHDKYAIVGAPFAEYEGVETGAAYIFKRDGNEWIQQTMLVGDYRTDFDSFGHSVAVYGKHAVVGAPGARKSGNHIWDGAVYFYRLDANGWQPIEVVYEISRLPDDVGSFEFGESVAMDGAHAIVGAPRMWNDNYEYTGAAGIYRLVDTSVALSAEPSEIVIGQSAALTWTSINADTVTIDQVSGNFGVDGSVDVTPAQTTTYNITATGSAGKEI